MRVARLRAGAALFAAVLIWAPRAGAVESSVTGGASGAGVDAAAGRTAPLGAEGATPAVRSGPSDPSGHASEVWINPGLYSRHFDRDLHLREHNWGIGVEWLPNPHHGLMLGQYHNSNDHLSRYVAYVWRPWVWDWNAEGSERPRLRTSLGIVVGAFNGYPNMRQGGWFLGALPVAGLEYGRIGMNLSLVPGYRDRLHGAVALQLRLRVW